MFINAQGLVLPESGKINSWPAAGSKNSTRSGTKSNDVFYASENETLSGLGGDDSYHIWDNKTKVVESANGGIDTIYAYYWGSVQMPANVENLIVMGSNVNYVGGNNLSNIIVLGAAAATVDAGAGDDVIVGGAGADVFKIIAGNGSDAIQNFQPGWDVIQLSGYNFKNFSELLAASRQTGSDVTVTLSSTEKLVLRDVNIKSLSASDFNMPLDKVMSSEASTHLYKANQAWNSNGWYVFNNVWGAQGLVESKDYAIESHSNLGNLTDTTSFIWSFPLATEAHPQILAYPELIFGTSPLNETGVNPTDKANVFPAKVSDLVSLTSTHDVTFGGNLGGFNVAYDIWLTNTPNGGKSSITNEIMIWVHKGAFEAYGDQVGTYTDAQGNTAKIYHSGTYTAIVFSSDLAAAKMDIKHILEKLGDLGIVSDFEYVRSIELGAEVVSGSGSLVFNNLDIELSTRTADGGTLTKLVTGTGTQVTTTPPVIEPPVVEHPIIDWVQDFISGSTIVKDLFGRISGSKLTTVGQDSATTVTTNAQGRKVASEAVTISGNTQTVTSYNGNGKLTGSTTEVHDKDGSVWLNSFDAKGQFVSSLRMLTESATSTVKQAYDVNHKLTGFERILTATDGSITTQHYTADAKLVGSDKTVTKADGSTLIQFFSASGALTGYDTVVHSAVDIRTNHYSAKGAILSVDVVWDMGNGLVKEYTADPKWNVQSVKLTGTDGNDTLWGSYYTTDFYAGPGKDIIGGGSGVDRIHFNTELVKNEADQIRGFEVGRDKIVLHDDIFTALAAGGLDPSSFVNGTAAKDANDYIIYNKSKGELYYDADGVGGQEAILFATFLGNPALSASDFVVLG